MKKQTIYLGAAFIVILLSAPLGRLTINIIYYNRNLSDEYTTMLNGFIHSFMLIGILVFILGLRQIKNNKL
jgi:hypothetical protein